MNKTTLPNPKELLLDLLTDLRESNVDEDRYGELPPEPAKSRYGPYEKIRKHEEDNKFVRALYKERHGGLWVHDWRIPFGLLKKYHKAQDVGMKDKTGSTPRRVLLKASPWICQKRADEISRPEIWTAVTFRNYVEDLTTSSVDRSIQRIIYGGATTHVKAVAEVLERLFEDVGRKSLLTPGACKAALEFLYHYRMIPKAQAIFGQVENLRITVEPETVNVVLRSTALAKDTHHFAYILKSMLRRGFEPTGGTWVALLMAVQTSEVRNVIFLEMQKRGLLEDPLVLKQAVGLVVPDKVPGLDAAAVVALMESQYGDQWISPCGANKLLFEFGRTKDVREVVDLLDILIERGMVPDVVTLNTLITVCSLQQQFDAAIHILRWFRHKYHLPLSDIAHQDLFKLAWSMRMYNCSRVLWRSACIEAVTTFHMKALIRRSLLESRLSRSDNENRSRGEIWRASAGLVVVGVSPNHRFDQTFAMPAGPTGSSARGAEEVGVEMGAGNAEPYGPARRKIAALIGEDLAAARHFHLVRDVTDLLSDALKRDREWYQTGFFKTKNAAWKQKNAVPVKMKPVSSTLPKQRENPVSSTLFNRRRKSRFKNALQSEEKTPFQARSLNEIKTRYHARKSKFSKHRTQREDGTMRYLLKLKPHPTPLNNRWEKLVSSMLSKQKQPFLQARSSNKIKPLFYARNSKPSKHRTQSGNGRMRYLFQ